MYLRAPHKPKFENVIMATTLDGLIACIVSNVIRLVLLKQIVSGHLIALEEKTLNDLIDCNNLNLNNVFFDEASTALQ